MDFVTKIEEKGSPAENLKILARTSKGLGVTCKEGTQRSWHNFHHITKDLEVSFHYPCKDIFGKISEVCLQ